MFCHKGHRFSFLCFMEYVLLNDDNSRCVRHILFYAENVFIERVFHKRFVLQIFLRCFDQKYLVILN